VLLGRRTICTKPVKHGYSGQATRLYGANVIPIGLPAVWSEEVRDITVNMFWNYGRKVSRRPGGRRYPNLHLIYKTNFKCEARLVRQAYMRKAARDPSSSSSSTSTATSSLAMTRLE
jgi:hypothetical protein